MCRSQQIKIKADVCATENEREMMINCPVGSFFTIFLAPVVHGITVIAGRWASGDCIGT